MESKTDLGSGARAFDQALEKTQSNIRWMNANVPVIATWLKDMGVEVKDKLGPTRGRNITECVLLVLEFCAVASARAASVARTDVLFPSSAESSGT
ncbi:hypothetical protein MAR_003157 [Mya arenaria]|uniref:Uncharacterized protein n=1 Tax=Mya arenaria TaxID=6604 RepID=A0ABY7G896_MYAAR|nr:hypothetical protein MAR_003157 [Mya arenaria]